MERLSVNGVLKPIDNITITDQYTGHFLKVSYTQEIVGQPVFSKDRIDVEPNGDFRFFVPKKDLIIGELVNVEAYSPDGEMLGKQVYSHGALKPSSAPLNSEDSSSKLEVEVNPKVISFNQSAPTEKESKKISGKLIDISGEKKSSGLQIIIMISDNASADFDQEKYSAVYSGKTDSNGYFYGQVPNTTVKKAYGIIAGNEDHPILIPLENSKLPKNIILVSDLSLLPEDSGCGCNNSLPILPDNEDLVKSSSFSQDLGGTCVDFTIPNRTLEEFSFYHTVRTTEPEIKSLTINAKESTKIKNELIDLSKNIFQIVGRLNSSFNSLSLVSYTVEETSQKENEFSETPVSRTDGSRTIKQSASVLPNYLLSMDTGGKSPFRIGTNHLIGVHNKLKPADILKIAFEQNKRKKKLISLQQKLAAAYCGKNGVEAAKSFCEELASQDGLNREELKSLIGHIENTRIPLNLDERIKKLYNTLLLNLDKLVDTDSVEKKRLKEVGKSVELFIEALPQNIATSPRQENIHTYLRKTVILLAKSEAASALGFEPCPPTKKSDTMGILCLIQKFDELKEKLQNTSIFSLAEILEIRGYYTIFLDSISAFVNLLDEFYTFYTANLNFATELIDDYFYENYDEIKSSLNSITRQIYQAIRRVEEIQRAYIQNHPGRVPLSVENSIDWDDTPTIYENTTIANGHILHFKQKWKADGYSLGDLLYSLPLAPCQEKQIAIIDWDREEQARRLESQVASDEIEAQISRDRDITEIMSSSFGETINASSTNKTSSTSAGIGGGIGGFIAPIVFGVAGGISHSGASSKSTANQNSSRNLSANSLNRLQDKTSQSASSLRSQRSTVIQTVGQNESVSVQTEVIKNNNHCHAMTVEYFEVLKHYAIEQELVDVQECLFVPMPMSHFDYKKVLRWNNTLKKAVYGRKLKRGFDAIERIETNYVNSDLPIGTYADEQIQEFTGHFTISFELERPFIKEVDEATKTEEYDLSIPFPWFFGRMVFHLEREIPLTEAEKDRIFEEQYAPDIVRAFIDKMLFHAIADNGNEEELDFDVTLLSNYKKGIPLKVSINTGSIQNITRKQIKHLRFRADTNVKPTSKIILRSAYLHYRTKHLSEYIIRNSRINNDIINSVEISFAPLGIRTVTDAAVLYTPLNEKEQRNPRKEDREAAIALVNFLNEYLEMSHKIIWSSIDSSRLFGILDGFLAPNSGGRSVASVVENKIMGIVGNNLVLKVIPGERLDPVFKSVENLMEYYQPTTPIDPYRISVPTKGVYAESVMGKCNSCEEIDETRHWRFSEEPCGTSATAIEPVSTASRRSDPGNLQVKDMPTNIINMQNAPEAPDPTGLAAAYGLLGKGDSFKDLTGLAGTQANALGALQTTSKSVTDLASISKDFASLAVMANQKKDGAKQIEQIKKLNKDGYLNDAETNEQIKNVLDSYNNAAKNLTKSKDGDKKSVVDKITDKVTGSTPGNKSNDIEYSKVSPDGESESIKVSQPNSTRDMFASNTSGNQVFDPFSPENQPIVKRALKQKGKEWAEDQINNMNIVKPMAFLTAREEYLLWAVDSQDPDSGRIDEKEAKPGSANPKQSELFNKLKSYAKAGSPGKNDSFYNNRVIGYLRDENAIPWSAAFISYIISEAGLSKEKGFYLSAGHSRYTSEALINRLNRDYSKPFWLFKPGEVAVEVGDIIVKGRGSNQLDFDKEFFQLADGKPRIKFENGEWSFGGSEFQSHADMVFEIRKDAATGDTYAFTMGGNTEHLTGEIDTVGKKKYLLTAEGKVDKEVYDALHSKVVNGTKNAGDEHDKNSVWAIIKILDESAFEEWQDLFEKYTDGTTVGNFSEDSFLNVFGTPNADGDMELPDSLLNFLQANNRGKKVFPESNQADFSDVDRKVIFKPIFQPIPNNLA